MALAQDPDFNIMQQSHGLFAITKLLVYLAEATASDKCSHRCRICFSVVLQILLKYYFNTTSISRKYL